MSFYSYVVGRLFAQIDFSSKDIFPDNALTAVKERRFLEDHLVENAAECPNICFETTEVIR